MNKSVRNILAGALGVTMSVSAIRLTCDQPDQPGLARQTSQEQVDAAVAEFLSGDQSVAAAAGQSGDLSELLLNGNAAVGFGGSDDSQPDLLGSDDSLGFIDQHLNKSGGRANESLDLMNNSQDSEGWRDVDSEDAPEPSQSGDGNQSVAVDMTAGNAHLLKDHLQNHPEFTGEGGAENTWNTRDLLHLDVAPANVPAQLDSDPDLEWFTSITGASWTDKEQKYHIQKFTGPQDLFQELQLFCRQNQSSSDSTFTIKGWKF